MSVSLYGRAILRPRLNNRPEQCPLFQHLLKTSAQIVPRDTITFDLLHVFIPVADADIHSGDIMPLDHAGGAVLLRDSQVIGPAPLLPYPASQFLS